MRILRVQLTKRSYTSVALGAGRDWGSLLCRRVVDPDQLEFRHDLLLEEPEEALLVGTDLVHVDLGVSRLFVLAYRLQVGLGIRARGGRIRHHFLGDEGGGLFEVFGCGDLLGELTRQAHVRPQLVDHAPGLGFVLVPADLHLPEAGLIFAGLLDKVVEEIRLRGGAYVAIPDPSCDLNRLGAEGRDVDGRRLLRQRVQAGVLHSVVFAVVLLVGALPQQPDHLHRLFHHLKPHLGRGPVVPEYVLVEVLSAADAEPEATLHHRRRSRRGLGDYRWVDTYGGAGDAGAQTYTFGDGGDTPDHAPHEWALALRIDPGMVVVRDPSGGEARFLRPAGVSDHFFGCHLLAGEHISHLGHLLTLLPDNEPRSPLDDRFATLVHTSVYPPSGETNSLER